MKYLSEYRDAETAKRLVEAIVRIASRRWSIMEVCGGQTHSIIRSGIDQLLGQCVEMIHGPGCPVCVTPLEVIDKALAIAARPEVIFCSFGDMLRVPGSQGDLLMAKAAGADVRVVYSPLDAVRFARQNPSRKIVFLAIGFETTAPANAMAVKLAKEQEIANFSALVSHVLVPPAIEAIAQQSSKRIHAFLAAGHVCCVTGTGHYPAICERYQTPIVVTGFEPLDLLEGIRRAVGQLERGEAALENAYQRVVSPEGNLAAQRVLDEVFEVTDRTWRGIGPIADSGWRLRGEYQRWDAEARFDVADICTRESTVCRAGDVLTGIIKPQQCAAFGKECTPRQPLGAPMVSSEGACAAYYNYGRLLRSATPGSAPSACE